MREIKFRAWVDNNLDEPFMAIQGTPDLETIRSFMHHWGDRPLMQFTGLKDKNGKEIYEGDILKSYPILRHDETIIYSQVIFNEHMGMWRANGIDKFEGENEYLYEAIKPKHYTEVIGNIYETPHLLNQ